MIEQMKNPNEYKVDGKLFIKTIKKCKCTQRDGDTYIMKCKITERGDREYHYRCGDAFLELGINKKLWLSQEAKEALDKEAAAFDAEAAAVDKQVDIKEGIPFYEISCEDAELSIFYREFQGIYDFIIKYKNADTGEITTEVLNNMGLNEFLHYMMFRVNIQDSKTKEMFSKPTAEDISDHPLMLEARKNNNTLLEIEIKRFYHLETSEDCRILEKILGYRILPPLPEEFNKDYAVAVDGALTEDQLSLLRHSGYNIRHRPYFAMRNCTKRSWTLNPHTKIGVDAAKVDAKVLSFNEFLKLFENC